ncbi:MAG: DUF4190 domain-containing protein [Actinomycetes bacterium]
MSYPPPPPPLPPGQPPITPGQFPSPWAAPPPNSGKAVAALVLGILGIVSCQVLGVVAIVLGQQAGDEIAASGGRLGGEGFARAGVIMGWVAVALLVLSLVGLLVFFGIVAALG